MQHDRITQAHALIVTSNTQKITRNSHGYPAADTAATTALSRRCRDWLTVFFQTLDIALNGVTNVRHRLVACFPLGNTAGQSRTFGNKNAVFIRFGRDTNFPTASVAIGGAAGNETNRARSSAKAPHVTRETRMVPKFSGVGAAGYSCLLTPYPGRGLCHVQ